MTDSGSEAPQENFSILRRGHGLQIDHVGLGVGDTESGVKWLSEQTGAPVHLREPEADQWYWSGSLPIAEDSFQEVIGPNPEYSGFQPFETHLSSLEKPTLLFWYICVDDNVKNNCFIRYSVEKRHRVRQRTTRVVQTAYSNNPSTEQIMDTLWQHHLTR